MDRLVRWDSETLAAPARFAEYCNFIEREYESWRIDPPKENTFHGWVVQRRFGEFLFVDGVSSLAHFQRTAFEVSRSGKKWAVLIYQRRGRQRMRSSTTELHLEPGDIALYSSARPCEIVRDRPVQVNTVFVPLQRMEQSVPNLRDLGERKLAWNERPWRFLRTLFREAFDDVSALTEAEGSSIAEAFIELLGAATISLTSLRQGSSYKERVLSRVQSYVEGRLHDPELCLDSIARAHGLSLRTLQRLFQEVGITPTEWIRVRRLERCRRDLSQPHLHRLSIAELAYRWGFSSATNFSRTFRTRYGISPQMYRRIAIQFEGVEGAADPVPRHRDSHH